MSFESDGDAQDDHDDALDHAHYQGSQRNEEKLAEASSNDKLRSCYHLPSWYHLLYQENESKSCALGRRFTIRAFYCGNHERNRSRRRVSVAFN